MTIGPRARILAKQGLLGLIARPGLTAALVIVWTVALTSTFIAESRSLTANLNYEDDLAGAGYRTLYIEPNENLRTPLTASDCISISAFRGAESVVWITGVDNMHVWSSRGPEIPVRRVGGDLVRFLHDANHDATQKWTGQQVFLDGESPFAGPPGMVSYLRIATGGAEDLVATQTARLTGLGAGLAGNMVVADAQPTAAVDACAVLVADDARDAVRRDIETAFPVGLGYQARWALPSSDRFDTPVERFQSRGTQHLWLGAALAVLAFSLVVLRARRSDHAFFAASGVGRSGLTWMVAIEFATIALVAAFAVLIIGGVVVVRLSPPEAAVWLGARASGRALLAMLLGASAASAYIGARASSDVLRYINDR